MGLLRVSTKIFSFEIDDLKTESVKKLLARKLTQLGNNSMQSITSSNIYRYGFLLIGNCIYFRSFSGIYILKSQLYVFLFTIAVLGFFLAIFCWFVGAKAFRHYLLICLFLFVIARRNDDETRLLRQVFVKTLF